MAVVFTEFGGELAGPAAAAEGGRRAAALGISLCITQFKRVINEIRADEGVVGLGVGAFLLVDQSQEVAYGTKSVSIYDSKDSKGSPTKFMGDFWDAASATSVQLHPQAVGSMADV